MKKGFSLISLLVFMAVLLIIISTNFSVDFLKVTDDLTDDQIKLEAYMIDHALSQYSASHAGEYPKTLQNLIDVGILSPIVEIKNYSYSPGDGYYQLSVKLNDDSIYTSPLSKN